MCKKLWKLMHFFKWLFFRLHCLFIFDRFFSNVRNIGCFKKIILLYYIYTDKKGYWNPNYSRVPNKRTGCLLENEKKNPTYTHLFRPIPHCFVSSNSFHGQITQKAVHQITDSENKNVAIDNFMEQTTLLPTVFEQERP